MDALTTASSLSSMDTMDVNSFLTQEWKSNDSTNFVTLRNASSLTTFEEFCGNSPFWDTDLLVDSSYPKFTRCFREIAVTWIPCLTYMVVCVPYLYYLLFVKPPVPPSKIGWVGIAKTISLICLLGITIATIIVRGVDDDQQDIPDAMYVSESIKIVTFIVCLIVSSAERRKGVVASAVSWTFWLFFFFINIIPFYTNIEEHKEDTDRFGFIIFIFFFFFVFVTLFIACFTESRHETYQDISAYDIKIECPVIKSSIPSRLAFWWMNKLVILGFKKTLEENDVFDPTPGEKLSSIMPMFERTWQKEKKKVDRHNRAVRASLSRQLSQPSTSAAALAASSVTTEDLNEETPLLAPRDANKPKEGDGEAKGEKSPYKKISVFKVIMKDHGPILIAALIIKACFDCFLFLTPKITEALLDYITNRDQYYEWRGYILATSYLVVNFMTSAVSTQTLFYIQRSSIRMKAALVNAIYRKSLTAASIGDSSTKGEINNLMSVSTEKIQEVSHYIQYLFSAPAQLVIALVLLYEQLGVAVFAGLAVMVLTLPINAVVGVLYEKWQNRMMQHKDDRSSLLSEIFNGIKVLKLYAWELSFQEKIEVIRNRELKNVIYIQYLVAIVTYFFTAMPSLIQVTAFGVHIKRRGYLDPTVCFVSLQLFNMLNTPLMLMPLLIPGLIQAMVAVNRISNYLNKPDINTDAIRRDSDAVNAVEIRDGSFTWTLDQTVPTLRNIDMEVPPGSLVAIVGTVGCGKSSLVSAMLGEMEKLTGEVILKGTTAYVPQEAWIQNATLRDNITFGKTYRPHEYNNIIEACALKTDLEILPGGDMTEIGEKGINISGGQKQRVSLARAVYSDRDIFLMDDPLSAVDSHVGKHIFEKVIGEDGVLKDKTRILVTHGIHWLPMVDKIFVMAQGEIREAGTYDQLIERDGDFARFVREYAQDANNKDDVEQDDQMTSADEERRSSVLSTESMDSNKSPLIRRQSSVVSSSSKISRQQSLYNSSKKEKKKDVAGAKLTEDEIGMSGRVRLATYMYYLQKVGAKSCVVGVFLYMLHAGTSIFSAIWLTEWTSDDYLLNRSNKDTDRYDDDTQEYLLVYAVSSIGSGLFVFIFVMVAAVKLTSAARILHNNMLSNVLRAPMSFFDTTPIGRILNRFSSDVEVMDQVLPMSVTQILNVLSLVIVTIVNICYGTPIFLVALIPLSFIYIVVQSLYIPTCRQLRRIEHITRSPIYVHFSETLNGSDSIRAYGCQERFVHESVKKVDHNIKFYFAGIAAFCWLTVWLNFLGNIIIFLAAIFAVSATDLDPSIVGLSVSYASSMTEALGELVNGISETETNIVSVERIKEYSVTTQEAPWRLEDNTPKPDWPETGDIVFDNYQTRYRPGLDLVLKDVTCTIKGGEKVGIVGRTGAGKSSMTVALFRIIESAGGSIVIDGEDVSKMGLHDLRSKLTILPQEPVIFCGSMRMNLDPFNQYAEHQLWNALEHSYLKEFVEGLPGQLEYECGEEGSNLSVGQRQLVCLARTLLRKTKILVLDEATAAVDMETDDLIQKTIRREFDECTILTIAHRLNTIIDYDRVMVLDKGQIKEFDSPDVLLADDTTIFHGMAKEAGLV